MPEELRAKIAHAAGGNPLFVSEMLAMADEAGDEVEVPPTLRALLAARLDQLDAAERRVLERGAVEGEIFHRGAVQALAPEETQVTPRLAALVRRELIRPDTAQFPGEDGFRFRHLLIRDAAYDALPKSSRAELHERFAGWLEQRGDELVELDEILGYHLEQASRYRVELGSEDEHARELARHAARLLAAAGRRAHARGDDGATRSLLERATHLVPEGDRELPLVLALLGSATYEGGDAPGAPRFCAGHSRPPRRQASGASSCARGWTSWPSSSLRIRAADGRRARRGGGCDRRVDAARRRRVALPRVAGRAPGRVHALRVRAGWRASRQLLECAREAGIRREEVWAVRGLGRGTPPTGRHRFREAIIRLSGRSPSSTSHSEWAGEFLHRLASAGAGDRGSGQEGAERRWTHFVPSASGSRGDHEDRTRERVD